MAAKKVSEKAFWDNANVKIGVFSGAIGIVLSLFSAISYFKPDKNGELEARQLELNLKEHEPRLEVSYIDVLGDVYEMTRSGDSAADKKDLFFLDYPAMENEILKDSISLNAFANKGMLEHTIYLMLQNRGKVAAMNIELEINRCILNDTIVINENFIDNGEDYETKIVSNASEQRFIPIKVPRSLETGEGILIPLMISKAKPLYKGPVNEWYISSKIVYLPKTLKYNSSVNEKIIKKEVRKMFHPLRISEGVIGRG